MQFSLFSFSLSPVLSVLFSIFLPLLASSLLFFLSRPLLSPPLSPVPLPSSPFSSVLPHYLLFLFRPLCSLQFSTVISCSSSVLSVLFSSPPLFPVLFVAVLQRPLLPFPKHTAAAGSITKKGKHLITTCLPLLQVIPRGFEPRTHSLEGCCSIQLSYETNTASV